MEENTYIRPVTVQLPGSIAVMLATETKKISSKQSLRAVYK